jgi:GTP cyclohydrolase I
MEEIIKEILRHIGEDPSREGLVGTPQRVLKMWKEIFRGYDVSQRPNVTVFNNGRDGVFYDQMLIDTGKFYSHCEHHMVPFFGDYWFAYIPKQNGKLLGLSKVARVVDYFAARLQIQERLGKEILDYLIDSLGGESEIEGAAIVIKAQHLCKTMRGIRKEGTSTTSHLVGCFKDIKVREEFFNLIK